MLEQSNRLGLDKADDHVAEDCSNSVEPLIRGTDVPKPSVIE
jgi:hypothetical protein